MVFVDGNNLNNAVYYLFDANPRGGMLKSWLKNFAILLATWLKYIITLLWLTEKIIPEHTTATENSLMPCVLYRGSEWLWGTWRRKKFPAE